MKEARFRQIKFLLIFLFGLTGLFFSLHSGQVANIASTVLHYALMLAFYTVFMLFFEMITLFLLKFYYHNQIKTLGARLIRMIADGIEIIFAILMILYAHDTSLNLP